MSPSHINYNTKCSPAARPGHHTIQGPFNQHRKNPYSRSCLGKICEKSISFFEYNVHFSRIENAMISISCFFAILIPYQDLQDLISRISMIFGTGFVMFSTFVIWHFLTRRINEKMFVFDWFSPLTAATSTAGDNVKLIQVLYTEGGSLDSVWQNYRRRNKTGSCCIEPQRVGH